MEKEEFIAITHFINPQLFWYQKVDGQNPAFLESKRLEESLQQLYTAKQSAALRAHRPHVGEIVAIAFVSWNKFIRARVVHVVKFTKAEDEFIVWALDYGFPFQTKMSYIRHLPESHTKITGHICRGGIADVIPAELEFDFVTTTSQIVCKQSWSDRFVEMLEKIINDAASISFIESFQVGGDRDDEEEKQHFGDMKIITHSGSKFFVSDYLVKLNYAVKCEEGFREKLATMRTNRIPCFETNSRDIKVISNKLNALNIEMGKFDLSGTMSELSLSCDNFSKQKVMDWCERNQNLNEKNEEAAATEIVFPRTSFDATDIEFDDSVSVKQEIEPINEDETVMGFAGKVHANRRRKYDGKELPPMPALGGFAMVPEKKPDKEEKSQSNSFVSGRSSRAKMLMDLKKAHSKTLETQKNENTIQKQMDQLNLKEQSDTGTEEFLEICKMKNAQTLQKRPQNADSNTNTSSKNSDNDSISSSTISKRKQQLMKIKEIYCKQIEKVLENSNTASDMHTLDDKTESRSQTGSKVSVHAQNLIDKRNKILLQRSQSDASSSIELPSEPKPVAQYQKQGYKMPQNSLKFSKLDFSKGFRQYATNSDIQPQEVNQQPPAEELKPKVEQKSAEEIRKLENEDPFKNMVMIPAGFNVTKLVKRRDEDNHWHTKKTTLNYPIHSNYSAQEYQNNNHRNNVPRRTEDIEEDFFRLTRSRKERKKSDERHLLDSSFNDNDNSCSSEEKKTQPEDSPFKNSSRPRPKISKERHILDTSLNDNVCSSSVKENIPETSHKNGGKSRAKQSEDKHPLDRSLNDSGCPPAITPEVVTDLLIFDDIEKPVKVKEEIKRDVFEEFNILSKLLDLNETHVEQQQQEDKSASSDSFLKDMDQMNSVKDTSREKLLETSNATSDDSIHTEPKTVEELCPRGKDEQKNSMESDASSSSISFSFFKKIEIPRTKEKEVSVKKPARDFDYSYEASASSTSSGSIKKVRNKAESPSSQNKHFKDAAEQKPQSKSPSSTHSNEIDKETPQSRTSSMGSLLPSPCSTPVLKEKLNLPNSNSTSTSTSISLNSPKVLNQAEYLRGLAKSYLKSQETFHHNLPEVSGEASLKTNFIQHLVLVHSKHTVTPIERMKHALFTPEIHQEMENMRLTKMYRIQAYAWSHLVRGNCFCVINANRTGKTWCYLPPVCSMLSFRMESKGLLQTCGAAVIIVAPSSVQVESIARHCRRLLASTTPKVSIVPAYGFRNTEEVKMELHNGCGVLVITPLCLQRLLEANDKEHLLNMQRVQTLIIDGLDSIMKENPDFDETLYKLVSPVLENDKIPFQLVVTSKMWTRRLINFLRIGNHPLLCIADYLEAAVYAKAKVSIKLQSSSEKMSVMMKCLDKCAYELERCVVLCNSVDEVLEVERCLRESGYMCMVYTEKMPPDSADMINEWKEKTVCHQILITSDSVLPELTLQNVWTLIHYSMPISWTKFNFRFSLFLNNYENMLGTDFTKPTKVPKCLILLDENNNLQLPRLIEFMRNHNQLKHIHPDILNVAARVTAEREELRVQQGVLMCPKILEFGSCDESNRCPHRHQLTKYDGPAPGIPKSGEIRLKILEVLSPTHYIARLLTQKQQGTWEVVRCSNEYATFSMKLTVHFMNEEAQFIHWPPRLNDVCIYKDGNNFHRCRLLEVPPILYESIVKLVNVKIKLIDSGSSIMCKSHDLLIIPDEFKDFPAQAIDVRLSGVVPFDSERVWDSKSTRTVKKWIVTDVTNKDVLQASINFVLMDVIWVNNVVLMEQLPAISGYALKINVRRSLLGRGFALVDDQIHSIKQTAMENGLIKPTSGITKVEKSEEEENLLEFSTASSEDKNLSNCGEIFSPIAPSIPKDNFDSSVITPPASARKRESTRTKEEWAFLELDEISQAKIAELNNPCMFYLRLMDKEDDMKDLEEHIRSEKKLPLEDPHPMQNCLAPLDGRYYRAKIQRLIVDSDEGCVKARVFYCDIGLFQNLSLEKLRSSNKTMIEFIPFQAICCKLTGIKIESEVDEILKVIQIEDSVHLAYAVKELPHNHDGFKTRNFEIILYECFTDKKDIQINKMLVEYGLATYNDETKHFLELETEVDFENFDYQEQDSYDFQSFLDRVKQQMDEEDEEFMNSSQPMIDSNNTTPEEPKIVEITDEAPEKVLESDRADVDSHPPPLKTLHKRPSTTWHETMCMIYLVINAPDISDYHLEVHPKRLIFVATVNGELNVLLLNLLGYVRPDLVTHEVRGLNVVVRLVKDLFIQWPRLLEDPTKFSWLNYNYNAIGLIEDEEMFGKPSRLKKRRLSCSSESTTDSHYSNPCDTFTPIVNHDQLHDPMQDIY